jgi:D-3-phosphoglycerate dehydrogenase
MGRKVLYGVPTLWDKVREVADVKVLRTTWPPVPEITEDEVIREISDADAVVSFPGLPLTRRVIEAAPKLKIIAQHSIGYDNVDIQAATDKKVLVTIGLQEGPQVVAEHAIGFMIALSRKFNLATDSIKKGEWKPREMWGSELLGKTVGIIGLGRIGSCLARIAQAFGMKIMTYDPYATRERARDVGAELVDLVTLLKESDYITIHVPLTEETRKLISEKEFRLMKSGAFLINCARGAIVDEEALYVALVEGRIAGAALDVFSNEPPSSTHSLFKLSNVMFTPHTAGATRESLVRLAASADEDVADVLKGKLPKIEKIINKSLLESLPGQS